MELTQLEKLLEMAAKYGVRKLKTPEIEVEFGMNSPVEPTAPKTSELPKQEISDEDMLYWSVDGQVPSFVPEAPKES